MNVPQGNVSKRIRKDVQRKSVHGSYLSFGIAGNGFVGEQMAHANLRCVWKLFVAMIGQFAVVNAMGLG